MNPILSIIIPVYNVENYVEHCITSCLKQNILTQEYEIIIVNDGSTDNSLFIAEKTATGHPNIKIISQCNKGLSMARNKGLSLAQGDYIWFVDSDDYIEENCLKQIIETCKKGYDVISLGWGFCYETGITIPRLRKNIKINNGWDLLKNLQQMGAQFYIHNKNFLRKNHLEFYPGIYHEDNEFTPRMLYFAQSATYVNQVVYHYLVRKSGSILSTPNKKKAYDLLFIANRTVEFAKQHVRSEMKYIFYRLAGVAINNSVKNIIQHSAKEQDIFYSKFKTSKKNILYLFHSKYKPYIIESIISFCSISLAFKLIKIWERKRNRY